MRLNPTPPVAAKLKEKLTVNGITNVHLHEVALGDQSKHQMFYPPASNNSGTGSFRQNQGANVQEGLELPVQNGDKYLAQNVQGTIDLVKIDVEGFEVCVLKGLQSTLKKQRPICFFEWSQNASDYPTGKQLFPDDYCFFAFQWSNPKLFIFAADHYNLSPLHEAWPNGNLLAIPKEYLDKLNKKHESATLLRRINFS